jgi:hypothetical protein
MHHPASKKIIKQNVIIRRDDVQSTENHCKASLIHITETAVMGST